MEVVTPAPTCLKCNKQISIEDTYEMLLDNYFHQECIEATLLDIIVGHRIDLQK